MTTANNIYVPKGLERIEELARMRANDRQQVEKAELKRLRERIHSHAHKNEFSRFSWAPGFRGWKNLGEYVDAFEAGHISVSSGSCLLYTSPSPRD